MSNLFPSAEWAAALKDVLDHSPGYRQAGKDWTHGAVALVVKAAPAIGLAEDVGLWLDVDRGLCREARLVSRDEAAQAPFCITGEYAQWKAVLARQLEPVKGMMQKKLELKGQMTVIVKHVAAAKELVECAARVPTRFLDEGAAR